MSALDTFLIEQNDAMEAVYTPLTHAHWDLALTGSDEAAARQEAATAAHLAHHAQRAPFEQTRTYLAAGGHDPATERQLIMLKNEFLVSQFPAATHAQIARLTAGMNQACSAFRGTIDGRPVSMNQATTILQESTDSKERQKAWEASKMLGTQIAPRLLELVQIRNAAARELGYPDFYHLSLDSYEIDPTRMFALWDALATQTDTPFRAMKGELDARLADRYGIGEADLRPWHYEDPFFQKAPQNREANLDEWYAAVNIETLTNETFRAMAEPIDDLVPSSSLYPADRKNEGGFCIHMDRAGDVRVLCNLIPNERWMATNLHEFGHAAYDKYIDRALPFSLRTPSHSITTEGIAVFHGNFATDPEWMALFPRFEAEQIEPRLALIRAQKQLEDMIFTRWEQVMCRFERELYRDPTQNLNALWWDLAARYQGLTPPEGRDAPDWAAKVHFAVAPCMYQNYLYGFMFITQLGAHLRSEITEGGPLPVPEVGRYLIDKIYKPGALLRWDALIASATGAPLEPEHWVAHVTRGCTPVMAH